jgi:hypothetical protein
VKTVFRHPFHDGNGPLVEARQAAVAMNSIIRRMVGLGVFRISRAVTSDANQPVVAAIIVSRLAS